MRDYDSKIDTLVLQQLTRPEALLPDGEVERRCHDDRKRIRSAHTLPDLRIILQQTIPFWANYQRHYPYFADLVLQTVWHMLHRYGADPAKRDWIGLSDLLRDESQWTPKPNRPLKNCF
jgi:hypothetical protein